MKTISFTRIFLAVSVIIILSRTGSAQTITTSFKGSALCIGEQMTVDYTITGSFDANNKFTVQLSDSSGSFLFYKDLGSKSGNTSGSITVYMSAFLTTGKYRIRVVSSSPYINGSDNGVDLSRGINPNTSFRFSRKAVLVGDTINFFRQAVPGEQYKFDFGEGAMPPTSIDSVPLPVRYSTTGAKTILSKATSITGCMDSFYVGPNLHTTFLLNADTPYVSTENSLLVCDCNPTIPKYSVVFRSGDTIPSGYGWVWLQPGATYESGGIQTIFAETGTTISLPNHPVVVYLKKGATYVGGSGFGQTVIVAEEGSTLSNLADEIVLNCSSLTFNYADAPKLSVSIPIGTTTKSSYPNPVSSILFIPSSDDLKEVSVTNSLGQKVITTSAITASRLQLDVSSLPQGVYSVTLKYSDHSALEKVLVQR